MRRLRRLAGGVRDGLRGASAVLLYHRVAEVAHDPWRLAVRPAHFAAQMAVLAQRGDVMPLATLCDAVTARRRIRRGVVVTFDDGYADFRSAALPVLERTGVPATLFVTTGPLEHGEPFWWDELERLVLLPARVPPELRLVIDGRSWSCPMPADRNGRLAAYLAVHRRVGGLTTWERRRVLRRLRGWADTSPPPPGTPRALSVAELRAVATSPLIELGAHTVGHPYLGDLPVAEQVCEIQTSRQDLERHGEVAVRHFSYPHGDLSAETKRCVRTVGFAGACGSAGELAHRGSDPFDLPRLEVPDLDGPAFAAWLAALVPAPSRWRSTWRSTWTRAA
jgi:peptidoglycan/xylan/chitin deacetylase (PgdA/CDA1 family)